MTTKNRLWFPIAQVFEEIHDLCVQARASEIVKQRRAAQAAGLQEMLQRLSQMPDPTFDTRFAQAEQLASDPKFQAKQDNGPDIVILRSELRKRLTWLKSRLAEVLTEREVYYCLFPIVIYCDELVHEATRGVAAKWEPLQSELYEIDNGGELFYTAIDTLLRKDDTHPLIFEVFYFCLRDGFVGMYDENPAKVQEHLSRLQQRIPIERPSGAGELEAGAAAVHLVPFPLRYYGAGLAFAVFTFFALHMVASYEIRSAEEQLENAPLVQRAPNASDGDAPAEPTP